MSYTVLTIAKIKNAGAAGGLNDHLTREMDVPNADPRPIQIQYTANRY